MKGIYISDINHNNHSFIKIDKRKLTPLFKNAVKVMREAALPKKLPISVMLRQMLILSSQKRKSKNDLEFMEELIYFVRVMEKDN